MTNEPIAMTETNGMTKTHRAITPNTILSEKLAQLQNALKDQGAAAELVELIRECIELAEPLDDYLAAHTSPPSDALNSLEERTNALDWDTAFNNADTDLHLEKEMLSGAVEGQFLKMLTAILEAKNVLEIGSFTGYASLAMAEALPEDGTLIACEYDRFTAEFARKEASRSPHGKKINVRIGDATDTLEQLSKEGQIFDMVFLDADKQGYASYYTSVMDAGLLRIGGLFCVDNTLYMGQAYQSNPTTANGEAIKQFNEMVANDFRMHQVLLPLRDGVTIMRRIA